MLLEIKVKVKRNVDNKTKIYCETYLTSKEVFAEAELAVMQHFSNETGVESYEILSIKVSNLKELYNINEGENTYIVTLLDTFTDLEGNVKSLKYKVLLWADNLTQANQRTQNFVREGYEMTVESLTAKPIYYIQ